MVMMMIARVNTSYSQYDNISKRCDIDPCGRSDLRMTLWQHLVREGTVLVCWLPTTAILHQLCKYFNGSSQVQLIFTRSRPDSLEPKRITVIITGSDQLPLIECKSEYDKVKHKKRSGGMFFVSFLSKCKSFRQQDILILTSASNPNILLQWRQTLSKYISHI